VFRLQTTVDLVSSSNLQF